MTERLRIAALTLGALALAWPAFGQIKGEAHGVFVQGADSVFRYRGLAGGGGIVWGNQLGVDGEVGLAVDDSDERSGVLMLAAGGSLRLPFDTKTSAFIGAGLARFGDIAGPYLGGGVHYGFGGGIALRVELRSLVPTADYRGCTRDRFRPCESTGVKWFFRAGLTLGFGA